MLGPDQIPGFPGGATPRAAFTPPPPFPEQPAPPPTDELARGLALGKLGLGAAGKAVSIGQTIAGAPGTSDATFPRDEAAFQDQRAGERMGLGDVGDALSPTEEGMIRLGESPFDLQYAQPDLNLGGLGGDPTFQPGPLEQPSTTSPSTSVQLPEGTIYGETSPQDLGLSPTEEGMIQLGENPFDLNYAQPDLNLGDLGDITGNLAGDLETSFNAGDLSVPAGEVPQTPAASDTGGIGDIADSLTESTLPPSGFDVQSRPPASTIGWSAVQTTVEISGGG